MSFSHLRHGALGLALAVLGCALPILARAVYVNADGLGQALIYPYYTAQSAEGNPFNTYFSVVNRRPGAAVVRVRVREGRAAKEVASFNLYLSGGDTWTAAIAPTATGARLVSADHSCVNGPFDSSGLSWSYDLSNASYTGSAGDGLGTGPERVREGYVEMIEMAGLTGESETNVSGVDNPGTLGDPTVPANCGAVQGEHVALQTAAPEDRLSGTLTLINVANGMEFSTNAVALAQLAGAAFYRDYGDPYPDFDSAEVLPVSHFVIGGRSYRASWPSGLDAVAGALTAQSLRNETILDTATNSGTNWIVTLPLRRLGRPAVALPSSYPAAKTSGLPFMMQWRARDGAPTMTLLDECGFLCPGYTYEVNPRLPWAASVLDFATGGLADAQPEVASRVLGSTNAARITLPTTAQNGAGRVVFNVRGGSFQATSLDLADGTVRTEDVQLSGVPAVGFMVRTFENGRLDCGGTICQGNYGGAFPHVLERVLALP